MARRIACRCRSRPSSPSHAMSAAYSRSWLRSKQPPPSARHARPRGPKPSEPHGAGLQERICSSSCLSWLPPSQELEPPAIPGRFRSKARVAAALGLGTELGPVVKRFKLVLAGLGPVALSTALYAAASVDSDLLMMAPTATSKLPLEVVQHHQ